MDFYWKGENKNLKQIYFSIQSSMSNPKIVLEFCDILYKFSIATIFYLTEEIIQDTNISSSQRRNIIHNRTLDNIVPERFNELIDEFYKQLNVYENEKTTKTTPNLIKKINKLIATLGIQIILANKWNIKVFEDLQRPIGDTIELVTKVNLVYNHFKDLYLFQCDEK